MDRFCYGSTYPWKEREECVLYCEHQSEKPNQVKDGLELFVVENGEDGCLGVMVRHDEVNTRE